jgi:hypothetical protein
MTSTSNTANLIVHIEKPKDMSTEEYTQLTRALMFQLKNQDVESVELEHNQVAPSMGAKGDPFTIGALIIVVVHEMLPKVMDFLQAWSLRGEGHTVKIKVQRGKQSAEIEYPAKMSSVEAKKHLEGVMDELWKNS